MIRDETVLLTNLVTCCSRFAIFPWRSSRPGSSLQKEKKMLRTVELFKLFFIVLPCGWKKISIISTVYIFIQLRVQDIYQKKKKCKLTTPSAPFIPDLPSLPGAPGSPIGPLSPWKMTSRSLIKVELKVKLTCKNKQWIFSWPENWALLTSRQLLNNSQQLKKENKRKWKDSMVNSYAIRFPAYNIKISKISGMEPIRVS